MLELLTTGEMAAADQLAAATGIPSLQLMENAGAAVAAATVALVPARGKICVAAGPGNNGGDGFVAARHLSGRGYQVEVALLGDTAQLKGDCAVMASRWNGAIIPCSRYDLSGASAVIDALFGAGLDRPLDGQARSFVERVNQAGHPVLAVDLPSGIGGNNGQVMGTAVRAHQTVTFFRRKPGHLLLPGRTHCGPVTVVDIGIPASVLDTIRPRNFVNAPPLWLRHFPVPDIETHKYRRGHAVVVSGEPALSGAARLSALAALRAGAGLVTIASPHAAFALNASLSPSLIVRWAEGAEDLTALLNDSRMNVVVLGPGGGTGAHMQEKVAAVLATGKAAVLDADALTSFVDEPKKLFTLLANHIESTAILTPHEGEFERIFRTQGQKPTVKQKLEAAREASHEAGAIIVLKGPDTVVAAPDGRAAIADNAPPWLATAGSGDVLAGMIGGLRAQGMPPFEAACAGVWLHGEAGSHVGPGLISEELPAAIAAIYRREFLRWIAVNR